METNGKDGLVFGGIVPVFGCCHGGKLQNHEAMEVPARFDVGHGSAAHNVLTPVLCDRCWSSVAIFPVNRGILDVHVHNHKSGGHAPTISFRAFNATQEAKNDEYRRLEVFSLMNQFVALLATLGQPNFPID